MNTSELLINQSTNEESDSIQIREDTTALKAKGSKKMPIIPILLIAVSITLVSGILFVSFADSQTIRKFNPLYKEVPKSLGDIKTDAKNLILYYRDYKQKADTDILRLLESIKSINQTEYEYWKRTIKYWQWLNGKFVINVDKIPEGLINDNSLCIVVLGYGLNADGSMKTELVKRLNIALQLANAYPNSYIAVTGGATGKNSSATEGGQMAKWLTGKGIATSRIIKETKAGSTIGNAKNVYKMLVDSYPTVKNLVMVTSDYHIPRGCLLFNTHIMRSYYQQGKPLMQLVSNAAPYIKGSKESDSTMASNLASIAGVTISGSAPALSKLTAIRAEADIYYQVGEKPKFKVYADYSTKFTRDVSGLATIGTYDNTKVGKQTVSFSYTENTITKTTTLDIYFAK